MHGDRLVRYGDLAEQVDRWAAWLIDAGVAPGDRVALLSNPRPEAITLFLATASVGAVFQGMSPRHRAPELTYQLTDAQPVVLIDGHGADPSLFSTLVDTAPGLRRSGSLESLADSGTVTDSTLRAAQEAVGTHDPAAIVYTSGSTGRPKGALLPHRGFTWPSHVQAERFFAGLPGRMLNNLPIDHVGSLGNISATSLVAGGTIVFQESFDPVGALQLVERERINYWGAVPAMFLMSVGTPEWPGADLSSVRTFIWSGGAAPVGLIEALRARGSRLSNSYGLTETVGEVTFSDPEDDDETLATTIGRPEARYEVAILREDGSVCDRGETGEISVRGDFVMRGYWNNPEATTEALDSAGWLHTGDLAWEREDGCYTLVGRKHEMFKSGGYNVYPREVELTIEEHPGVDLAAVVSVPDQLYGEVGHAFVVADPLRVTGSDITAFLKDRLATHKVPKTYTIVSDLPMTGVGKVDKVALRAELLP